MANDWTKEELEAGIKECDEELENPELTYKQGQKVHRLRNLFADKLEEIVKIGDKVPKGKNVTTAKKKVWF